MRGRAARSTPTARRIEVRAATCCWPPAAPASCSPSPPTRVEATGDGVAMALRAGVAVADVEFVQFHPTALHHPPMPRPLLSEALRGHGALLRDANGERFVDELLPRDVVSRAITERMLEQGVEHVWLDATGARATSRSGSRPSPPPSPRSASTRPPTGCRSPPPPTTAAAASSPTSTARRRCPGCGPPARSACNGVHGRQPPGLQLAARRAWCSRPGPSRPSPRARTAPEPTGAMRAVLDGDGVGAGVIGGRRDRAAGGGAGGEPITPGRAAGGDDRPTPACCARPRRWPGGRRGRAADRPSRGRGAAHGGRPTCSIGRPGRVVRRRPLAREESRGAPRPRPTSPTADPDACAAAGWCRRRLPSSRSAVSAEPSPCTRRSPRCARPSRRALAEDLDPLGDLTAGAAARRARRRRRRSCPAPTGVLAGTACATETFAQLDPAVAVDLVGRRRRRVAAGVSRRHRRRPAGVDPHRRAHRAELPQPPLRRRHPHPPLRRRRGGRRRPAGCGTPARPRPGCARSRRRRCGPAAAGTTGATSRDWVMLKDNHLGRLGIDEAVRRARAPWPARTVHVECDSLEQGRRGPRRPGPTPSCSTTWRRRRARCRRRAAPTRRRRPAARCSRRAGGITLETIGAVRRAPGVDLISIGPVTHQRAGARHRPRHRRPERPP